MASLTSRKRNIFVVGLDDIHHAQMKKLPAAEEYTFHSLFTHQQLKQCDHFPVRELLQLGPERLRSFPDRVDAVIGYWDFPVSTVLPILRREPKLPGPTLESTLKCEHKYWSRLQQAQVIPEHTPNFCLVDPFAADPLSQVNLEFPFWIKPVKSVLSYLGFCIEDEAGFAHAIKKIRRGIGRFAEPFSYILSFAELPEELAGVEAHHCIAEAMISAKHQCTLEGYRYQGQVHCYGLVDSFREGAAGSSFSRYQYPSRLPKQVQQRIAQISSRAIQQIGYDNGPFNIEFFWDPNLDVLWLLEINPRISKSHSPLFKMVDGCFHHQVNIDLGLGRKPQMPNRAGEHRCAAKFMVRRHEDAWVSRAPTREEIEAIEAEIPNATIQVDVEPGMRLSELRDQDSYSFEVATLFVGGADDGQLMSTYQRVMQRLPLEFSSRPTEAFPKQVSPQS